MSHDLATTLSLLYLVGLVFTISISIGLTYHAWGQRQQPGSNWFIGVGILVALTALTYLVGALVHDGQIARTIALLRIPMTAGIIVTLVFSTLDYSGGWLRLSCLAKWLIGLPGIATILVILIDSTIIFATWRTIPFGYMQIDQVQYGGWFWVHMTYCTLLMLGLVAYLFIRIPHETGSRRRQLQILTIGMIVSFALPVTSTAFRSVLPLNLTPLGSVMLMCVYGYLLLRYRFLDIIPFAFDSVFRSMSDGVMYVNSKGLIAHVNPAAASVLGMTSPDALLGKPFAAVMPSLPLVEQVKQITLGEGERVRYAEVSVSQATSQRGEQIGAVVALRDVTDAHRLHEAMLEAEKLKVSLEKEQELNDLKTQMMIRIAHEFRTPLATIQLMGDLLTKYYERMTPEQRAERIQTIRAQTGNITDMLEDISTVLRGSSESAEPECSTFDLVALARGSAYAIARQFPQRPPVVLHSAIQQMPIHADEHMMMLALENLLSNAAKFSPEKSQIVMELGNEQGCVTISVRDEGIGIPLKDQMRIYEPFFRGGNIGEVSGLGLGLSLVRDIVQAHQGEITLMSIPGSGTMFSLHLPVGHVSMKSTFSQMSSSVNMPG